jgi:hypothetical protein
MKRISRKMRMRKKDEEKDDYFTLFESFQET